MDGDTVISIAGIEKKNQSPPEEEAPFVQAPETGFTAQRPMFQRVSYPPRISLNGILVGLLCTVLLVVIGFMPVSLPSPLNIGAHMTDSSQLSQIQYTFQLPLTLFVAALLGPFMGTASVLLFVVMGLCFYPVFANGGGLDYITQPGFGYLLGALVMASLVSRTFHKAFQKQGNASRSLKVILQAISAILILHGIGVAYLAGLAVTGQLSLSELPGWALRLTVETAPYDLLITAILLCLVRQIRLAFWLVLY